MHDEDLDRVPVIDEEGHLIGIVGRGDYALSLGICMAIFFIGITAFNYAEQTAMDSV